MATNGVKLSLKDQQMLLSSLDVKIAQVKRAEAAESDVDVKAIRQAQVAQFEGLKNRLMSKDLFEGV